MRYKYLSFFLISVSVFCGAYAQTVSLTGVVRDCYTKQAISGATVTLSGFPQISAVTKSDGSYTLSDQTSVIGGYDNAAINIPYVKNNLLYISVPDKMQRVCVEFFSVTGRRIDLAIDKNLSEGKYSVDPLACGIGNQVTIARVRIGDRIFVVKTPIINNVEIISNNLVSAISRNPEHAEPAKHTVLTDTIIVSTSGYRLKKTGIASYSGTLDIDLVSNDNIQGKVNIASVSQKGLNGITHGILTGFPEVSVPPAFIHSAEPDSMVVTLKTITVKTDSNETAVWSGSKDITLKGNGIVALDSLTLNFIPKNKINSISLIFANHAKFCGSLTGIFNVDTTGTSFTGDTLTVYTKQALAYNKVDSTGGADGTLGRYSAYTTGPAELADVMLSNMADAEDRVSPIETACDFTYDSTDSNAPMPTLTILFDLSRMMRFYNGCNLASTGGVDPSDPSDKAYFFCHSVFRFSIAAFFGQIGRIQGYQTMYADTTNGSTGGVPGWMTMIYDSAGTPLSGMLIGDDDNALTIAKGSIDSISGSNPYDFHYNISDVDVSGFNKQSNLGDSTIAVWHQADTSSTARSGIAKYTLRFQTNGK